MQNSRVSRGEIAEVWVCCSAPKQRRVCVCELCATSLHTVPPHWRSLSLPRFRGVETSEARSWVAHRERSERCGGWGVGAAGEVFRALICAAPPGASRHPPHQRRGGIRKSERDEAIHLLFLHGLLRWRSQCQASKLFVVMALCSRGNDEAKTSRHNKRKGRSGAH